MVNWKELITLKQGGRVLGLLVVAALLSIGWTVAQDLLWLHAVKRTDDTRRAAEALIQQAQQQKAQPPKPTAPPTPEGQ